ncbi:MAG: hypothetical protein ACRC62_10425 [Microcoleus sp.]
MPTVELYRQLLSTVNYQLSTLPSAYDSIFNSQKNLDRTAVKLSI